LFASLIVLVNYLLALSIYYFIFFIYYTSLLIFFKTPSTSSFWILLEVLGFYCEVFTMVWMVFWFSYKISFCFCKMLLLLWIISRLAWSKLK
jgi:hypothetical protein